MIIPQAFPRYNLELITPAQKDEMARRLNTRNEWIRFRHCQAWYQRDPYGRVWIKSYDTLVACIDTDDKLYRFGWYSVTTSKQTTQIYNALVRGLL